MNTASESHHPHVFPGVLPSNRQPHTTTLWASDIDPAIKESKCFHVLFEQSHSGMMLMDIASEKTVAVNASAANVLGLRHEDALENLCATILLPDDYARLHTMFSNISVKEQVQEKFITTLTTRTAETITVEMTVWHAQLYAVEYVVMAFYDISDYQKVRTIHDCLYKISEAAHTAKNLEELFRSIHKIIGGLMPSPNFYIALYDVANDIISFPYFVDEREPPPPPQKPGRGLTEYVLKTGEPLLSSPSMPGHPIQQGKFKSIGPLPVDWLGVPLKIQERAIGVLVVQSYTEGVRLGEEEKHILMFVSTQIAMAIVRVQAEEKIRKSEAQYRQLAETARDIILTYNMAGQITYINKAGLQFFEYDFPTMLQKTISDFLPEENPPLFTSQPARTEDQENAVFFCDTTLRNKSGREIPVEICGSHQYEDDKSVGVLIIARDITRRKDAEDGLRHLNRELEARVQQRTRELEETNAALQDSITVLQNTQDQLVQAEKMSDLGGLLAGILHEISTPVGNGITAVSYLEHSTAELQSAYQQGTLRRSDLEGYTDSARESVGIILRNLKNAADYIRSFKQVIVDRISEKKRTFLLDAYIHEVLLNLRPLLKKTRHVVTVNVPENLKIYSYPGVFSQILTNFVTNSLIHGFEHTNEGHITLDVSRQADELILRYSDDGKGMDEKELAKIFEIFYTTKPSQGGSGLGLHIVHRLVTQRLNGRIHCASVPGEGTTFTIYIPQVQGEQNEW